MIHQPRLTRPVSWIAAALKDFEKFPTDAKERMKIALAIAADGGMADVAKPMKYLGSGVFEIALAHKGNAYRTVYTVQLGEALWVIHAFQEKSTQGIKTPKHDIDLIEARLKRVKQMLKETAK